MENFSESAISEGLHRELCTAITELARSVDIAVKHIALRSRCTAAIADAEKVERAAEALRAVALEVEQTEAQDITLVPAIQAFQKSSQPINAVDPEPAFTAAD